MCIYTHVYTCNTNKASYTQRERERARELPCIEVATAAACATVLASSLFLPLRVK